MQPVTSCGEANEVDAQSLPKLNVKEPTEHSDADAIVVDVIDNGASSYDPPAMPWDVLEAVQLFNSRPHIWYGRRSGEAAGKANACCTHHTSRTAAAWCDAGRCWFPQQQLQRFIAAAAVCLRSKCFSADC